MAAAYWLVQLVSVLLLAGVVALAVRRYTRSTGAVAGRLLNREVWPVVVEYEGSVPVDIDPAAFGRWFKTLSEAKRVERCEFRFADPRHVTVSITPWPGNGIPSDAQESVRGS